MDTSLPDCDCLRLLRALEDEELPDHLCWEIAAENVGNWLFETLAGREIDHADAFYDPLTTAPADVLDAAQWVAFQPTWPLRVDGRYLVLVLRQWVEEEPNRTLAVQLRGNPAWLAEVERYREINKRWRAHPEGHEVDADDMWIADPDHVWRSLGADCGDPPERVMALRLRQAGLPDSPATMRHLRAMVAGRSDPPPSRGVLVTSQVLMQARMVEHDGLEAPEFHSPSLRVLVSEEGVDIPESLRKCVNATVRRHRRWYAKHVEAELGPNLLTDRHAKHRAAQRTSQYAQVDQADQQPPHPLDYVIAALDGLLEVVSDACVNNRNFAGAVTKHLDATRRRVSLRHLRLHRRAPETIQKPQAPPGWREMVKELARGIRDMLKESGGRPTPAQKALFERFAAEIAARTKIRE